VSAKQKLSPLRSRGWLFLCLVLALFLAAFPPSSRADSLEDAARALARKVASMLNAHEGVSVSIRNLSSLSSDEISNLSQALEAELQSRDHKVSHDDVSRPSLLVTFSENLTRILEIGELVQNGLSRFSFEPVTLGPLPTGVISSRKFTLVKELVWKQESPILDLKFLRLTGEKQERIAVLSPSVLSLYDGNEMNWSLVRSLPIPQSGPQSRDSRAQLFQVSGDEHSSLIADFPNQFCSFDLVGVLDSKTLECNANGEKELIGGTLLTAGPFLIDNGAKWNSSRNYFTGELFGENGIRWHLEPFFSAGFLGLKSAEPPDVLITAGIDGRARVLGHNDKELQSFTNWGNDITTVHSTCDDNWRILASARGGWTDSDKITAYRFEERNIVALDQPVVFPGPVLSLGSELVPTDAEFVGHHDGAIAVIRNLNTGEYEAYRISIACSR
jgi:hypothetical protein